MLKIYNTLTRKKEVFKPLKPGKVNIFVCGVTVYDNSHIGHARTYIIFDAFVKYLRKKGLKVFYLQNVTDIDDKIIARAKERNTRPKNIASFFEKDYLKDMKLLGVDSVSQYAKATEYIPEIISQVRHLINNDIAYIISDGVYFDISKFKDYGKLSKRTMLQAEDAISRIDDATEKKNKGDFCLWKFSKAGEPKWQSPWGQGRPGWHIEDTAITEKFFGPQYDIHGGAMDLMFPHHDAEIAQMESISKKSPMVKYWMHTGFLTIENEKMSKSLGNFKTINDFLGKYPPNYLRFLVIKNLWRSPIDYSEKAMLEVDSAIIKIEDFLVKMKSTKGKTSNSAILKKAKKDFYNQLDDDFNTPKALAILFELIKKVNKLKDLSTKDGKKTYEFFEEVNDILGIINLRNIKKEEIPKDIRELADEREKLRKENDWEKADEVRKKIEDMGYKIEDTKDGVVVKKKDPR